MEDITNALLGLLTAILSALAIYARAVIADWMARKRLDCALGRAAGLVMQDSAVQAAGQVAMGAAMDAAVGYVQTAIPDTLRKLGVDDGRLGQMIRGEVGKLTGRGA